MTLFALPAVNVRSLSDLAGGISERVHDAHVLDVVVVQKLLQFAGWHVYSWHSLAALWSGLPLPVNTQQVFFGVVMRLQPATIGVTQRFTDSVRQVDIGRRHEEATVLFFDAYDSL